METARREILEAAERRLAESGPAGIRLQDVARDVGVSHPAVLHHFGSREGLVRAVADRAIRALEEDLVVALQTKQDQPPDAVALLDRVFDTLEKGGHARLLAWLVLSGHEPFGSKAARANWTRIADVTHQGRLALRRSKREPSYEDTQFTILLSALVLFAEAIAGRTLFRTAGLDRDAGAARRFRQWFAEVLLQHMLSGG